MEVKAYLTRGQGTEEIRRITVAGVYLNKFDMLKARLIEAFPSLHGKTVTIFWKDSDNDNIIISSDEELAEAVRNMKEGVFKVFIKEQANTQTSDNNKGRSGIMCDGCGIAIQGPCFTCLQCEDFDLCLVCRDKNVHPEHRMQFTDLGNFKPEQGIPDLMGLWSNLFGNANGGPFGENSHPNLGNIFGNLHNRDFGTSCPFRNSERPQNTSGQKSSESTLDDSVAAREQCKEVILGLGSAVSGFLKPFGIDATFKAQGEGNEQPQDKCCRGTSCCTGTSCQSQQNGNACGTIPKASHKVQ